MVIGLIMEGVYWHLFTEGKAAYPLDPAKFVNVDEFIRKSLECGWPVYRPDTGQVW